MSLAHFEVAYHLIDNPSRVRVIRLLTSDDPAAVDDYLRREHGPGKVVLHYAEREQERVGQARTCGYCGRTVFESEPRPLHPATLDKSLWRLL